MITGGDINTAVTALQRGMEHFHNSAERLTSTIDPGQLAEEIVELKQSVIDVKVQAAVVRTHDEIMGSLLDTFA
jgi:hypothetical protein